MSILHDESQQAIAAEAARILAAHYSGERLKKLIESKGAYDASFWDCCKEQGWTAIGIPEEHGGIGLGLVELGLIAAECGAVTCGAPFLTSNHGVAQAILRHGSDIVKGEWLERLATGEVIGAVAFAERADMLPAMPSARIVNARLTGAKPAVSGGAVADVALVLASGVHGPALALVPLAQDVVRSPIDTFDNSRCAADLRFDGAQAILLDTDDAIAAAHGILAMQAVVTAHEQMGGAQAAMTRARDYALERRAFGQSIASFQSVKHRIAENYVLVELARANALHAASLEGKPEFNRAAAAARLSATEAYDTVSRDATQIHGGIGVTWEADLHLHQRRARTLAQEQGSAIFWEDALVDQL